jgi:peptidoglycan hydrolase-like protein with peptidoglycan-binding domain
MGAGDEGLRKALGWGKRTVEVQVYGEQPAIEEAVYFDSYMTVENFMTQTVFNSLEFPTDLYFGNSGEEIREMQQYLHDWGYLSMDPDGFYGSDTAQAVFQFQMDFEIVSDPDELGAGHFGPATRRKFDELIKNGGVSEETVMLQRGRSLMAKYTDLFEEKDLFITSLEKGDSGDTVRQLQDELRNLGYLRIEPTGTFGETTAHALFIFQQAQGLVASETDSGAGYLGPNTRNALNAIIEARYEAKSLMAYQREELTAGRLTLPLPFNQVALTKESQGGLPQ